MTDAAAPARILVVEDDRAVLDGLCALLELAGYTVAGAGHGAAALARLPEFAPHLIVSDIMMPQLDGYGLYAAVRARPEWAAIPFIFLTARGEKPDLQRAKEAGVDDYLIKPFEEAELLVAIRGKLARRAQLDDARQRQLTDLKHAIISALNHEFRTPLTHITSYLELLRETAPDAVDFKDYLAVIEAGAARLQRLVEDFVLLAELRSGEAQQVFELRRVVEAELPGLLTAVVEQCRPLAAVRGLAVELRLGETPLPPVRLDREYLGGALRRLVENALKFTPAGAAPVRVEAETAAGEVFIRVIDHGRGIPASELERIFELFYQSDRARQEQQGIGAGLTIAAEIARLHGGELTAASRVGQGSTFTLRLPAAG